MRRIARVLIAIALVAGAQGAFAGPAPVVLELFTSNSCSSCPPAYALLRQLRSDSAQAADVPIIVLSEHVDYWNDLGWVDRYSSAEFTQRQRAYARDVFGRGRVYTPQLVINGRREMVGSREREVRSAIAAEAGQADLPVSLNIEPGGERQLDVTVTVTGAPLGEAAAVRVALTENDVVSHVGAGENGGRRLHEDGVVHRLETAGTHPADADEPQRYTTTLAVPDTADRGELAVAAFVQQNASRRILGAAQTALEP